MPAEAPARRRRRSANEKPDVDVWHWQDARVNPAQKLQVAADRRRNLPAVWHVATNKLVVIGKSFDESVTPIRNTTQALVSEFTPYLMERSIGRGAADWFIADLTTGARTPLKAAVAGNVSISTGGKYAIYADGGHYWTIDLPTKDRDEYHAEPQVHVRRSGVGLHGARQDDVRRRRLDKRRRVCAAQRQVRRLEGLAQRRGRHAADAVAPRIRCVIAS